MNQEENRAEALFKQAMLTSVGVFMNETLSHREKVDRIQEPIKQCQEALKLGLPEELGLPEKQAGARVGQSPQDLRL